MTTVAVSPAGTRRARILAHLAVHPGLTAWELGAALGCNSGSLLSLLRDMECKAELVQRVEWRSQQRRRIGFWYAAPPGTVPPPRSAGEIRRRRERDRESQRRRRARARGLVIRPGAGVLLARGLDSLAEPPAVSPASLPPGAACRDTGPGLFFGAEDERPDQRAAREARARAVCAACPVRRECYALAVVNGERSGIWGGVDFETGRTESMTTADAQAGEAQAYVTEIWCPPAADGTVRGHSRMREPGEPEPDPQI